MNQLNEQIRKYRYVIIFALLLVTSLLVIFASGSQSLTLAIWAAIVLVVTFLFAHFYLKEKK